MNRILKIQISLWNYKKTLKGLQETASSLYGNGKKLLAIKTLEKIQILTMRGRDELAYKLATNTLAFINYHDLKYYS
jgi:hypothetical protein